MYGKMQESGLTEIIPCLYISAIWGQYTAGFSHSLTPPPEPQCSSYGVEAVIGIAPPGCPWGSEIHIWRARIPGDCDILAFWYGRKYSFSQYRKLKILGLTLNWASPVALLVKNLPAMQET